MEWSSFSSTGREPLWMTGWFTIFTSQPMVWWSVCSKSMSQWWVTLCVLPQWRLCYLLLQWPCCYTSLSCGTTLLRSLSPQLILQFFLFCMHIVTLLHTHTYMHSQKIVTHKHTHTQSPTTFFYLHLSLPVSTAIGGGVGEGKLVTWLYALAARVREIIVMHSRFVIFSFFFPHNIKKYKLKLEKKKKCTKLKCFRRAEC